MRIHYLCNMTKEKKNPILVYILLAIILGILIWQGTFRLVNPKHEQEFEAKIQSVETYYNEAKAISLSMPLLGDSIVGVYADSLLSCLVHLNHDWVIYVKTHEGFENYTEEIEELNERVDRLRIEYELVRSVREINRSLRQMEDWKKRLEKQQERKYST